MSWILKKKGFFSNLFENEAVTQKKSCVAQQITHKLLIPWVYISNETKKGNIEMGFHLKLHGKVVGQKCPP